MYTFFFVNDLVVFFFFRKIFAFPFQDVCVYVCLKYHFSEEKKKLLLLPVFLDTCQL